MKKGEGFTNECIIMDEVWMKNKMTRGVDVDIIHRCQLIHIDG